MGKRSVFPVAASAAKLKLIMEANATLSAVAGAADGVVKTEMGASPDMPYLIQNPIFQFWSDAASFLWQQRKLSSENKMQQDISGILTS